MAQMNKIISVAKFYNLKQKPNLLNLSLYVCPGYEGDNCEVDIDECQLQPCENGGECFQRSDTLNYRTLPELNMANFTYEQAAGFICRCLPGFTGKPVHHRDLQY